MNTSLTAKEIELAIDFNAQLFELLLLCLATDGLLPMQCRVTKSVVVDGEVVTTVKVVDEIIPIMAEYCNHVGEIALIVQYYNGNVNAMYRNGNSEYCSLRHPIEGEFAELLKKMNIV